MLVRRVIAGKPDFSYVSKIEQERFLLPGQERPTSAVVYSIASIEQIPTMPMDYLKRACDVADKVVGFHFEPISFQIKMAQGITDKLTQTQRHHADHNDYSQNYYSLLRQAEEEGLIRIYTAAPDWLTPPANGFALVRWSCMRPGDELVRKVRRCCMKGDCSYFASSSARRAATTAAACSIARGEWMEFYPEDGDNGEWPSG